MFSDCDTGVNDESHPRQPTNYSTIQKIVNTTTILKSNNPNTGMFFACPMVKE